MNKEQFTEWYTNFCKKYNGIKVKDSWFDSVESAHTDIRTKIGGNSKILKIKLESVQRETPKNEITSIVDNIYELIPLYFRSYNFDKYTHFLYPEIALTEHKDVKIGKHISNWANQVNKDPLVWGSREKIDSKVIDQVNTYISQLGQIWSRQKTDDIEVNVGIFTDARAFTMIGHYGIDKRSCFSQCRMNQHNKYYLGRAKDSYVILVSKTDKFFDDDSEDILARAWGTTTSNHSKYNCNNLYIKPGITTGNIFVAFERLFMELLGTDCVLKEEDLVTYKGVYTNIGHNFTFFSSHIDKNLLEKISVIIDAEKLETVKHCPNCDDYADKLFPIDGISVCQECLNKANVCQHTGSKTLSKLFEAYREDGSVILIKPSILHSEFIQCYFTAKYYHHSNMVSLRNGKVANKKIAEENGYKKCDKCYYYSSQGLCQFCDIRRTSGTLANSKIYYS
jgi:hypothetical protein